MSWRGLALALTLLTRLPLPAPTPTPQAQGESVPAYPLVGLIIGGLLVLPAGVLQSFDAPPALAAALVLVVWVGVTGALHLDGLADSADGWLGGHGDRARTLAIMRDPAVGVAGVAALVLLLLLKWTALWPLLNEDMGLHWLLLTPVIGRAAALLVMLTVPYVRTQGMAAGPSRHLARQPTWVMLAVVGLAVVAVCRWPGAAVLVPVLAGLWLWRRWMMRHIGGYTGDTLGATIELAEALWLTAAVLVAGRGG